MKSSFKEVFITCIDLALTGRQKQRLAGYRQHRQSVDEDVIMSSLGQDIQEASDCKEVGCKEY